MRQNRDNIVGRFLLVMLFAGSMALLTAAGCDRQAPPPTAAPRVAPADPTPPVTAKNEAPARSADPPAGPAAATTSRAPGEPAVPANGVIAYYFHRTLRCQTCLAIEQNAKEAIETAYSDALDDGRLVWQPVNYQASGNEHFEKDFALDTSTLVLVEMQNGKQVRWKKLPEVWELVGDLAKFQEYVWAEVAEYTGG